MPTAHLAPPARAVPQVFELIVKSVGFVPVTVMLDSAIDAVLELITVTFCGEVVVPTFVVAKAKLAGLTVIAVNPVPERGMFWTPG